jgi:hypothetical protein
LILCNNATQWLTRNNVKATWHGGDLHCAGSFIAAKFQNAGYLNFLEIQGLARQIA